MKERETHTHTHRHTHTNTHTNTQTHTHTHARTHARTHTQTLYGFSGVAEGTMSSDNESEFLSVDAVFENNELLSLIHISEPTRLA